MPRIDLSAEIHSLPADASALPFLLSYCRLLSAAYFPDDTLKQIELIRYLYGAMEVHIEEMKEFNITEFKEYFENYLSSIGGRRQVFEAPNTKMLSKDLKKSSSDREIAGEAFLIFYVMVKVHNEPKYATLNTIANFMKDTKGCSRSTFYNIWEKYKKSSHILASIYLNNIAHGNLDSIHYKFHSVSEFEQSSYYRMIADVFIWAYEFQLFGTSYVVPFTKETLLKSEDIWLVPEQSPWPPDSLPFELPELPPHTLRLLRGY